MRDPLRGRPLRDSLRGRPRDLGFRKRVSNDPSPKLSRSYLLNTCSAIDKGEHLTERVRQIEERSEQDLEKVESIGLRRNLSRYMLLWPSSIETASHRVFPECMN